MVKIQCETLTLAGTGKFRCHRCGATVDMPSACPILLLSLPRAVTVWDAEIAQPLHRCRTP